MSVNCERALTVATGSAAVKQVSLMKPVVLASGFPVPGSCSGFGSRFSPRGGPEGPPLRPTSRPLCTWCPACSIAGRRRTSVFDAFSQLVQWVERGTSPVQGKWKHRRRNELHRCRAGYRRSSDRLAAEGLIRTHEPRTEHRNEPRSENAEVRTTRFSGSSFPPRACSIAASPAGRAGKSWNRRCAAAPRGYAPSFRPSAGNWPSPRHDTPSLPPCA